MAAAKKLPLQTSSNANVPASIPPPGKTIEETYQKKTQLKHILVRPDAYIGSIDNNNNNEMLHRPINYVLGLYKIFDGILVNAADNKQRDPSMDAVRVTIDVEQNLKKTTGGRNGYGAKLTNICLTEFVIETPDGKREKKYKQVFSNNMGKKSEPIITKCKGGENWTKVSFKPDFAKFNMTHLEDDVVAVMKKRVSFVNSIATIKGGTQQAGLIFGFFDNVAFDSQTKETLTIRQSSFGLKCELSQEFLKKVAKSGVVESLFSWVDFKQSKDLKKTDGTKRQRITGITKLEDANDAGGKYSDREASHKQIMENAEIQNIKQILGLQHRKEYDSVKSLRYGHLMIMTDQATHRNGKVLSFNSMPEYESWRESLGGRASGWSIKYYKGLGTSTSKEGKEYFNVLESHRKNFIWEDEKDGEAIELAFSKKKIEARKNWL
ncbi:hypothetical protein RHSIM_Rhsim09G0080900 [Rhododendron simsii]|uniref:DNA topoisomerase (ATP-hydrolyzing) n=1 Tax=Rhododendron simsii TaxID=118357 RepID=A0A834GG85_RHOSS|nr:hypothetical protein RHSIM_Rhsim09G0080900 [Rhododendron simsii]